LTRTTTILPRTLRHRRHRGRFLAAIVGLATPAPADLIDTWLITHGTQIPIRAIQVGGGN